MQNPNSQSDFIQLEIRLSALERILRCKSLHFCELHCHSPEHKARLQRLLVELLAKGES